MSSKCTKKCVMMHHLYGMPAAKIYFQANLLWNFD